MAWRTHCYRLQQHLVTDELLLAWFHQLENAQDIGPAQTLHKGDRQRRQSRKASTFMGHVLLLDTLYLHTLITGK